MSIDRSRAAVTQQVTRCHQLVEQVDDLISLQGIPVERPEGAEHASTNRQPASSPALGATPSVNVSPTARPDQPKRDGPVSAVARR